MNRTTGRCARLDHRTGRNTRSGVYPAVCRAVLGNALPNVGTADARYFARSASATVTLSAEDMDTVANALRAHDAPESLIRRFATG